MTFDKNNYTPGTHPDLPPPPGTVGVVGWFKNNLFSSLSNSILTLLSLYLLYLLIEGGLSWFVVDAVVDANDKPGCRKIADGACWAVIVKRFDQFIYGFYPLAERWRIDVSFCLLFVAAAPLLYPDIKFRKYMLIFSCLYPFIAFILIKGGFFNLLMIETNLFGGAMLTVIIGVTSIACSLPLGILLALGRQSRLKLVKVISVCFIEFMRGVPLITLLFVASTMLNYFLPPGTNFNLLIRVIIMMTFFSAAYIAEVIRGGIQAIPKGQYEAADAIGLTYWQTTRFITLPQALKISIPGIVNTFIGLYKDTTLVVIIGLLDPLGIGIACHKGSLLGKDLNNNQPSQKLFESLLYDALKNINLRKNIYLEAESSKIGNLHIPQPLWKKMLSSKKINIETTFESRVKFLLNDYKYAQLDNNFFKPLINGLKRRLSKKIIADWKQHIKNKDWKQLTESLLTNHYDPAYISNYEKKNQKIIKNFTFNKVTKSELNLLANKILNL